MATSTDEAAEQALGREDRVWARGYLAGMWAFAWWKDGTAYVGTTGSTFKAAAERFLEDRGMPADLNLYGYGRRAAGPEHVQGREGE